MSAKSIFIDQHKITNSLPSDPGARIITTADFTEGLNLFLESDFKGCISISQRSIDNQSVLVCGEYAAYFFKLLLCEIYGRSLLNLDIISENSKLIMRISTDEPVEIDDSAMRSMIKAARNACMDIELTEDKIILSLDFEDAKKHKIYAISPRDGSRYIADAFYSIFFGK